MKIRLELHGGAYLFVPNEYANRHDFLKLGKCEQSVNNDFATTIIYLPQLKSSIFPSVYRQSPSHAMCCA